MKITYLLLAAALGAPRAVPAQDIAAEWHGAIAVENDAPLRLALHIVRTGSGGIRATLDSIDEGGMDLPVDSITVTGSAMNFEMKSIGGAYQGKIAADGSRIVGTWSQDNATWALTWLRGEDPGNTVTLFDEHQALENGRAYIQWFYAGKISDLWKELNSVLHQALGAQAKLSEFRQRVLQQMGAESRVLDETVRAEGALRVYRRLAKFDKEGGTIELTLAFDAEGAVARFNIRPLSGRLPTQ